VKCSKAQSLILDRFAGGLDEAHKREIDLHLMKCPECQEMFTSLRGLIGSLKSIPQPDPGDEFWRAFPLKVEREIESIHEGKWSLPWIRKFRVDWSLPLFQPGKGVYAFIAMTIIAATTVFLLYPRFIAREGRMMRGGEEITVPLPSGASMSATEPWGVGEGEMDPSRLEEDLTIDQLRAVHASLHSSALLKGAEQELTEPGTGGVSTDLGSELNDLSSDELNLLSRTLQAIYPDVQEKGVL